MVGSRFFSVYGKTTHQESCRSAVCWLKTSPLLCCKHFTASSWTDLILSHLKALGCCLFSFLYSHCVGDFNYPDQLQSSGLGGGVGGGRLTTQTLYRKARFTDLFCFLEFIRSFLMRLCLPLSTSVNLKDQVFCL